MKIKKKTVLKLIFIPLGCILFIFLSLTHLPLCTILGSHFHDNSTFLRDCNNENPNFGDTPLTKISLLGSHDAMSNDINYFSASNTSEDNFVNNWWIRFLAKGAIVRYSRAQKDNIYDQLRAGVRYIDARITYVNGNYYNSHGLLSQRFDKNLKLILRFLHENPGEFVLFQICKYYKSTSNDEELYSFMNSIKYEDKSIFDYINYSSSITEFKDLTYNNLTDNGTKAGALIFSDECNIAPFNQFNFAHYESHWHNIVDNKLITQKIIERSEYGKTILGDDYLRVNQAQQTPNGDEIWGALFRWSLLNMAKHHNLEVVKHEKINVILEGLPIYMCDYATCNSNGFNDKIISLMKDRNINL